MSRKQNEAQVTERQFANNIGKELLKSNCHIIITALSIFFGCVYLLEDMLGLRMAGFISLLVIGTAIVGFISWRDKEPSKLSMRWNTVLHVIAISLLFVSLIFLSIELLFSEEVSKIPILKIVLWVVITLFYFVFQGKKVKKVFRAFKK